MSHDPCRLGVNPSPGTGKDTLQDMLVLSLQEVSDV